MHAASEPSGSHPTIETWRAVSRPARPLIREVLVNGPCTRTELARRLGLSNGSLTRLTKPLVQSGLLVERGIVHDPLNGHPMRPLDIVAKDYHFLGVKLTSDRMYGVVTDLRAEVVAEHSEPLGVRTPEAVAAQASDLRDRLARDGFPPVAAGFTLGGHPPADDEAAEPGLFNAPFLDWWRVPLESVLNDAMGIPCVVRNDVLALACGQHWFGVARGLSDFALVTAGAGIGYALCRYNRILETTEEDVVEFGHHILDLGGPMCPTGHRGCVSAYLSTGAILSAAAYGLHRPVSLKEISRRAGEGEPVSGDIARQAGWALGALAASIANLTTVKTVLVAGESVDVIRAGHRHIEQGMSQRRFRAHRSIDTPMLSSTFTDWARGGAVEAIRTFVVQEDAPTGA
ncbi:ROK family transcriptional regulator [Streptomyces litchfieldiae]|uniref:ROK family transcriptional regulator n=1 Tax=Streptomyces litchfieldiae TaxID=3075543 RepID=A0ABU2N2C7_9ACTN|nr:ROK family transcriptional regulator [Streptomyces sp. DSM 44938]MDT0347459.1 ROK family transcriptional regulator [Streptomyces sp. DSM 44938]